MAAPHTLQRLHKLIWVLIYGGLLTLVLGLATGRSDAALGWSLALLLFLRHYLPILLRPRADGMPG